MKSRILIVFMFLLTLWSAMLLRGAYLQIIPNQRLAQLSKKQFATKIDVSGRRGVIVDRSGRELAVSIGTQSLFADPSIIEAPRSVAKRLSKLLGLSQVEIHRKLKAKDRRFVWIKRHLEENEVLAVRKWDIRGLGLIEEAKRIYPNDKMGQQILGFVGAEGDGLEGIELKMNQVLTGEKRKVILPRDARGRPLLPEGGLLTNVSDGARVELTLDSQMQFVLEKELREASIEHLADGAVGIVMDPNTGEILAMASVDRESETTKNRAITDAFEAGSVMKTFVIATALREGQVKPSTRFYAEGGRMKVGDRWIREADQEHEFGWLTVSEILSFSSNIGTAKIALGLGDKKLYEGLSQFGFGEKLGIELPGESKGILQPLPWRSHLLSNISFGHGLAVTPLQVVTAYSAIANGGTLYRPFAIKRISTDNEEKIFEPEKIRRVMDEEQASVLRLMLRAATMDHSTGVNARISGFPVAGKTGTAQKVDLEKGGYKSGAYVSSFAGFVPANSPRFAIFVSIDNPKKDYYASQVAAPVFARLAKYAVRSIGLAPVLLTEQNLIHQDQDSSSRALTQSQALSKIAEFNSEANLTQVPNLSGLTLREVYQRLKSSKAIIEVRGKGVVKSTYPTAGEPWENGKKIRVFLESLE